MEGFNIISAYSRKNALEDGVLIDVTEKAKDYFVPPVAVTRSVMAMIEDIPEKYKYQSNDGRLYDILYMGAIKAINSNDSCLNFKLILPHYETRVFYEGTNKEHRRKIIVNYAELKAVIGPGDDMNLVVTIMLPNED